MRILYTVGSLKLPRNPDDEGVSGAVHAAIETARALVKHGHEVWVAAVGQDAWETTWHGVKLVNLKLATWAQIPLGTRTIDFRVQLPLIALTLRYRFDVVQGYLHHYLRFLRAEARVIHFHVDPFYTGDPAQPMQTAASKDFATIASYSDVQAAVSNFVAAQLRRGLGTTKNIPVVRNGINSARFNPERWQHKRETLRQAWNVQAHEVVFGYAGAVVPEKGVLYLASAFEQLRAQGLRVHLVLAGGAALWDQSLAEKNAQRDYENNVRALLDGAACNGHVHTMGKVKSADMPGFYAACDVIVVPSVWQEAFGLVALEALAMGRPVIASATGGLGEVVDDASGMLVEPGNSAALASAMRSLVADPALRARKGDAARQRAQQFSWEAAAQQLHLIYIDLLRKKGWSHACADL